MASLTHAAALHKPAHAAQQRQAACKVHARLGGFGGGSAPRGGSGRPDDNRLIIPGQGQQNSNQRQSLVLPNQQQSGISGGSLSGGMQPTQNFRPPPGFMDSAGPGGEDAGAPPPEAMLERLRSLNGHWYELAKLLPLLARAGYDGMAVEEATGLERKTQNVWGTAAQVHESIRGVIPDAALAHYDVEGEELLYELRFLSIKQRAPVATYIAERNLSPHDAQVLARAVKEHERREGRREGFGDTPGDVLAYKHFRDAQECRRTAEVEAATKKGLAVADSDTAREKLSALLGEDAATAHALPTANLTMLRMARDELGFRPLAVAGTYETATAAQVLAAPKVSSEGVFGNFKVPAEGLQHEWVALPNWSLLTLAGHPVALTIENCANIPEVRLSSQAKTEDELKRMSGLGVLVVDIAADAAPVAPEKYYLAEAGDGSVQLMAGGAAAEAPRVLGPVLFLCRPPSRDTAAATTSELLSM